MIDFIAPNKIYCILSYNSNIRKQAIIHWRFETICGVYS